MYNGESGISDKQKFDASLHSQRLLMSSQPNQNLTTTKVLKNYEVIDLIMYIYIYISNHINTESRSW